MKSPGVPAVAASSWMEGFSRSLIQRAARSAPASLSERLEEEWLAHLGAQRAAVSKLWFAIGCCWATRVISFEHFAPSVAAAGIAAGDSTLSAFGHDSSFFSRRTTILLLILCLHALLIYSLASGFARRVIKIVEPPPDMNAVFIDTVRPREALPVAPDPNLNHRPIALSKSDLPTIPPIEVPVDPHELVSEQQRMLEVSLRPKTIARILGGPGQGFPNTDDYYPSSSRRLGENGVTTVRVCVDSNGLLRADPTIAQTSGSARLDEGALKLARAGSGHYRATIQDGQSVSDCYPFRIRFALR
jgi:TonB family protein